MSLSRREFIEKGVACGLGAGVAINVAKRTVETLGDGWEHGENYGVLNPAPWDGKCSMVYETHGILNSNIKQFSDGDVVTFEKTETNKSTEPILWLGKLFGADHSKNQQFLAQNQEHVYRIDIPFVSAGLTLSFSAGLITPLALISSANFFKDKTSQVLVRSLGEASFLKAAVELYAGFSSTETGTKIAINSSKFLERLNPGFVLVLTLRNLIAAEKNAFLAEQFVQAHQRPCHLVSVWGTAHGAIERNTLQTSDKRIQELKILKPLAKNVLDFQNPYLWSCKRINTATGEVKMIEVPSLKALFTEGSTKD